MGKPLCREIKTENTMTRKAPGKHYRKGITAKKFYLMFPDNATAEAWFIEQRWPDGVTCPRCGSDNVQTTTAHKTMPFRCRKSKKAGSCGEILQREDQHVHGAGQRGLSGLAIYLLSGVNEP